MPPPALLGLEAKTAGTFGSARKGPGQNAEGSGAVRGLSFAAYSLAVESDRQDLLPALLLRCAGGCGTAKIPNSSVSTVASHDWYSPWLR